MNLKTGVSRKQSTPKFRKNKHFLPPNKHTVTGGKKCLLFGNFGVLCFLKTPVFRFTLLSHYRENNVHVNALKKRVVEEVNQNKYRTLVREHSPLLTDYEAKFNLFSSTKISHCYSQNGAI